MADERLERWAAERVPELLARAEEEAAAEVKALLREALVEAALGQGRPSAQEPRRAASSREPPSRTSEPPEAERRSAQRAGEAQWLYAVGRAGAATRAGGVSGVAGAPVRALEENGLVALVSPVPLPDFGEELLKVKLNDLAWLEEVARAHQRVVDDAFERGPVVPLRLCTIYEGDDRVRELLRDDGERFGELIGSIEGREEWSVKLFVDPERLAAEAAPLEADVGDSGLGAGGAYLARRKSARTATEAADRLAGELAEEVHARLQDWATDAVIGRPQNPELSGHSGQMLLNGAYLVETERAQRFGELFDELQEHYSGLGARLEISGPWPPYNFIAHDG